MFLLLKIRRGALKVERSMGKVLQTRLTQANLPFLQVLLGPRQVGKSTIIEQVAQAWQGPKIVISADGVTPPNEQWIEFYWQKAIEHESVTLLAFDEIQKVKNWSEAIKQLWDRDRHRNKLRVVLSGSASLTLQTGLTESLAGRYELIRCPHWTLEESREAFQWDLLTYLKYGGYPSAAGLIDDPDRWQAFIRDGIVEPVIGKDLQNSVVVQKPALLRQLFSLAMHYPAQEISYQKLLGQLQDEGNTTTLKHYLDILKGGFLIETLEKFSGAQIRQKSSSPKIIPMAPALIHAFTAPQVLDTNPEWKGRVFEAAIGAHLLTVFKEVCYWREGDFEVDFVVVHEKQIHGIEVKSGRRRNQRGLQAFKKKFPEAKTAMIDWDTGGKILNGEISMREFLAL